MALLLTMLCILLVGGVPNDECTAALQITGAGIFPFQNEGAALDGPPHAACSRNESNGGGDDIASDVWYCWTANCDGVVTVDTCGQTSLDTRLAVYDGCQCPHDDSSLLACNDDFNTDDLINLGQEQCGTQSRVQFNAVAGQAYLIRLGSEPSVGGGEGTFTVTCGEVPTELPCAQPDDHCRRPGRWGALEANGETKFVADDFSPAVDGALTTICWWGAYVDESGACAPPADAFEVTYYTQGFGLPGPVLAGPFRQSDGSLTVEGPIRTTGRLLDQYQEYAYSAVHDPVNVVAGGCYWVQIINRLDGDCRWYWEMSNDDLRDVVYTADLVPEPHLSESVSGNMSFCTGLPLERGHICQITPSNDKCANAIAIREGMTPLNTTSAVTSPYLPDQSFPCSAGSECCAMKGDTQVHKDVWYKYTAQCGGTVHVDLCDATFDAKIGVYKTRPCDSRASWIACNDDFCGDPLGDRPSVAFDVEADVTYWLQVGGFQSFDQDYQAPSDCFTEHAPESGGGCDDPYCEATVCGDPTYGGSSCCNDVWDRYCVRGAYQYCSGHAGLGTIHLGLTPQQPAGESLRSYAEFSLCFSASCAVAPCDPPEFHGPICPCKDYDVDGDVDRDDYKLFQLSMTGPLGPGIR